MNATYLAIITAWIWFVLVFANRCHATAILVLWWWMPILMLLSAVARALDVLCAAMSFVIDAAETASDKMFDLSEKNGGKA